MRPRTPLDPDAILEALNASDGDIAAAALVLGVSERTLYRRMAEAGIQARIRYEKAATAA